MIPLFKPYMAEDVAEFILPVLHSGYIGEGSKVVELEKALQDWINNKNLLTVNSGTTAITMALLLAGVRPGDLVISTPMTCLATNLPILHVGAKPLWADVDPLTGNIAVESVDMLLKRAVSSGDIDRIKVIVCVYWGGYPCDLDALHKLANGYGIPVIEDAAHALGSMYHGFLIGDKSLGSDYVCFSFQAIKHLTCGDGGAIIVPKEQYDKARLIRWYGLDRTAGASMRCIQDPPVVGYKWHMNDISASIGLANFKRIESILSKVLNNASKYNIAFKTLKSVIIPTYSRERLSAYWLYTLNVKRSDSFIEYMLSNGVECSKVHARNDTKTVFSGCIHRALPGVDEYDAKHVCIPVGWWLSEQDSDNIVDLVRSYRG